MKTKLNFETRSEEMKIGPITSKRVIEMLLQLTEDVAELKERLPAKKKKNTDTDEFTRNKK